MVSHTQQRDGGVKPHRSERLFERDKNNVWPVADYKICPVPGIPGASCASGFIQASAIPDLTGFMSVNPRKPKPAGSVPVAICHTLTHKPANMAIMNAGLYLLAATIQEVEGGLVVVLRDPRKHGLVNGGHTYTMIRQVKDQGSPEDQAKLDKAFVPIHVYSGIPDALIVDMASGLNHTKQVQETSLEHLRGHYDEIKRIMEKHPGADAISYFEGDSGTVPISEVLAFAEMFNLERYPLTDNPSGLYAHRASIIKDASEDFANKSPGFALALTKLPDILRLADTIRKEMQAMRTATVKKGGGKGKPQPIPPPRILLPFLGERVPARLPNGWLYPILSGFRANAYWDAKGKRFHWKESNAAVLKAAAPEFLAICRQEQASAGDKPEWVGKRESAYRQCKMQVDLIVQRSK